MKWLYAAGIGVLVVVFAYFLHVDEAPVLVPFPETLSDEPDVVIEGFDLTHFDENGERTYRIEADQARYFKAKGHAEIADLNLTVYASRQPAWELHAGAGIYNETAADPYIDLSEGVELTATNTERGPLYIESSTMRVYPNRQVVESASTVTVREGNSNFRAERFEADLSSKRVVFSSRPGEQVELLLQAGT